MARGELADLALPRLDRGEKQGVRPHYPAKGGEWQVERHNDRKSGPVGASTGDQTTKDRVLEASNQPERGDAPTRNAYDEACPLDR